MLNKFLQPGAVLATCALLVGAAQAGVVTTGTVYRNTAGELGAAYSVDRLHNQSGLSAGYTSGVTDFGIYVGSGVTHATSEGFGGTWLSSRAPLNFPLELDFDLGSSVSILTLALWNGTAGNTADVNAFRVFTSSVADFSSSTLVGSFNNPIGSSAPEVVGLFDLNDSIGQYVRITLDSYYGNGCCTGIGEVAFETGPGSAVPTPGTLALAAVGLLAAAGVGRRKGA